MSVVTRGEGDKLQALPALCSAAWSLPCIAVGLIKQFWTLVVLYNREIIMEGFSVCFGEGHACLSWGLCFQIKVARSQPGRGYC